MDNSKPNEASGVAVLGEMAVKQRLVTPDQLKICLAEQSALRKAGRNVPLGQIFIKRHLLTAEQVREILLGQKGISNSSHLVNGKYALVRKLGQGGAGEVYLARDTSLDRPVAIKILREEMTPNKRAVERFVREAKVLARIRHPHIVSVHETGRYQDRHYFVMDYVDGKPLDIFVKKGNFPLRKRIELLSKVAEAVGEVHRHGVVHRDLKPSNVLISEDGNPFLLDFGLARDGSRVTKLTVSGTILGTPFYMAPEQVEGKDVDSHTDVYALGVLLYEATTGRLPFRADNDFELYRKISSNEAPTPSTINRRVPRDLEIICLKAMDKDPQRRYSNASELADDLQRYLDGQPIIGRRLSFPIRVFRKIQEHKILGAGVAGSLLVGMVALGFLLTAHFRDSSRIQNDLNLGDKHFSQGRLLEAKEAYNRVRGLDPENRAAFDGLAKINERQNHIESRLAEAARILDRDPIRAKEIYLAVLSLDRNNSSSREGIKIANLRENTIEARKRHSEFLSGMHERIMKFESAYTLPPDNYLIRDRSKPMRNYLLELKNILSKLDQDQKSEAIYLVGKIQAHLGNSSEALTALTEAIEISPQGRYYYQRGLLALARYRNEFMRGSARFLPTERRASILEELKPLRSQAHGDFEKAIETGSVELWQAQLAQAVLYYTSRQYSKARQECEQVIQSHHNAEALKLLGQIALDQSINDPTRFNDAIKWFKEATNIYRSDYEAYAGLGTSFYYQALDRPKLTFNTDSVDRAIEQYDVAIRLRVDPALLVSRGKAFGTKAEWLTMTGHDSEDANHLSFLDIRAAKNLDPKDPLIHNWLAITLLQNATGLIFQPNGNGNMSEAEKKVEDALFAINEAIRIDPTHGSFYQHRGVAYGLQSFLDIYQGEDPGLAIEKSQEDISRAIKLGNNNATIYEAKALTHLWKCIALIPDFNPMTGKMEALEELDRAIESCTEALLFPARDPSIAKTHTMRGTLRSVKGLYAFFLGRGDECIKMMKAASDDFSAAGNLVEAYRIYDSEAFVSIRKAMELQLKKKDPTKEYQNARKGLTELLSGNLPNDKNAFVLKSFCLLYRGFANFHLKLPEEAIEDWNTLIRRVPPFKTFLKTWIRMAEKQIENR